MKSLLARLLIVLAGCPFSFLACGESPNTLQLDPTGTSFVHYNCTRQGVPYCGLWVYQNGRRYDGIIDETGLHLELIE